MSEGTESGIDNEIDPKKYKDFLQLSLLQKRLEAAKEQGSSYGDLEIKDKEIEKLQAQVEVLKGELTDIVESMNPKQYKLYIALSDGKTQQQAIKEAGYKNRSSVNHNDKVTLALKKYRELSQLNVFLSDAKVILNKNAIIYILSDIIRNTKNDKTRLSTIALFSKIMGYEEQKIAITTSEPLFVVQPKEED